ncbi:MAG TPA: AAA family ATPase [Clostridiales bacterium]|nr:AAA family ATPase [Clostridiales bacterium]
MKLYLKSVTDFISKKINYLEKNLKNYSNERKNTIAHVRNNIRDIDGYEMAFWNDRSMFQDEMADGNVKELRQLKRALYSPFFGNMLLRFAGDETDGTYYIGIKGLYDDETLEPLVLDWRAPIAGLFYENEVGPCSYESPNGSIIDLEMSKKNQILVRNGILESVTDISDPVHDTMLLAYLNQNATREMKNIVASLQCDQNRIVRINPKQSVFLFGPAGSGKTSIALHRAAFLLYKNERLQSDQIVFISPKKHLHQYISCVLPSLNEDNIRLHTYEEQRSLILKGAEIGSPDCSVKLGIPEQFAVVSSLGEFAQTLESECFLPTDIVLDECTVPKEEIERLFFTEYKHLPLFSRLRPVKKDIKRNFSGFFHQKSKRDFLASVNSETERMLTPLTLQQAYDRFLLWLYSEKNIKTDMTGVDLDIAALLQHTLFRSITADDAHYLIIDEMQDLTLLQHAVMNCRFNCPFLIVGDINQSLNYSDDEVGYIQRVYRQKAENITLYRCYRSTYEIVEFSKTIIRNQKIEGFQRHGDPVEVHHNVELGGLLKHEIDSKRWNTIAVITPDSASCEKVAAQLSRNYTVGKNTIETESDVYVYALDKVKGLEFDCVLVCESEHEVYRQERGENNLYIAVTRALHKLILS